MTEHRDLLRESLQTIERLQHRLKESERPKHEPIAIVGAGCHYPGGIETPEALWLLVRDGKNAVADVPPERWDVNAYYDPDPNASGKMVTRRGGFLSQVDRFDPQFFGISPREASTMDPQQRLLLETAVEAFESAGIATDSLVGSKTGVFVGITANEYLKLLQSNELDQSDVYIATGNALNAAAGRVSFTFGLQGPCVVVDTACSSSLVAVHLACQSLRNGESNLALAGGVNVILLPDAMVLFSRWGMMAPDGTCKTFDAAADGFVRSEGCAMIALKRLSDAIADGSPILAVIRGSAVNSDGRSSGLTVPNGLAQQALLKMALSDAGLEPIDISYVEAHGTGTPLGDPIEAEALGAVMRKGRPADQPLMIGSVKTNLGHTEAASGLAGLLKTVLALQHEAIPPHLHFSKPNPGIRWSELPIAVPRSLVPWPRGATVRRAGVSSFGFSGTNAHVIIEEAPQRPSRQNMTDDGAFLIPVSARDDVALRELTRRLADFLVSNPALPLGDVAVTSGAGRAHMQRRLALLAPSSLDLERDLRQFSGGQTPRGAREGTIRPGVRQKIAFLFTGQGAQYANMGRRLYDTEPVFRAALDKAAGILKPQMDRPLLELIFPADANESLLSRTGYTQPALFALQYSLLELWRSWGITPSLVLGHSVGEYAAAYAAGMFSLKDGLALIAERGRLMQELPEGGAMAAVFADHACVAAALLQHRGSLDVAAINGPEEIVISGDADAMTRCLAELAAEGIQSKPLDVSHAFHSARLDPMLDALQRRADGIACASPRIPFVSNLTGDLWAEGTHIDGAYWRRHAREPVRFAECISALGRYGVTTLLEIGPHPTLLALAARAAPEASWTTIASLRRGRDERREMLSSLAQLYVQGSDIQWHAVHGNRAARRVALPTYPFQRERHWAPDRKPAPAAASQPGHPLLGERRELAEPAGAHVWQREIGFDTHPWLRDHCVQGLAVLPASAYIEMALAAGKEVLGTGPLVLRQIENRKPIALGSGSRYVVQTILAAGDDGGARFTVHGRAAGAGQAGSPMLPWVVHMTAQIAASDQPDHAPSLATVKLARERCSSDQTGTAFYAAMAEKGNAWGPCFQGLDHVWLGGGEAIGRVRVPSSTARDAMKYHLHPAVSDACAHVLVALTASIAGGAVVGHGVDEVVFHRTADIQDGCLLWVHAQAQPQPDSPIVRGDLTIYDDAGRVISETRGARVYSLDKAADDVLFGVPDDWYYNVRWHRRDIAKPQATEAKDGVWIVLGDSTGVAAQIASRRDAMGLRTILVRRGSKWYLDKDRAVLRPSVPSDYAKLIDAIGQPSAILHLWSLDVPAEAGTDFAEAIEYGPQSILSLLKGLQSCSSELASRIWLVTSDAQPVIEADKCTSPFGALLWGLGKALSAEHPAWWGGLIDLGKAGGDDDIAGLLHEIEEGAAEDKIAFRGGQRYVPRLERRGAIPAISQFAARADGTYLVTGGLGGIGLAVAQWLVERGARHLLLLGRTPLPPRHTWNDLPSDSPANDRARSVAKLEVLGAEVETVVCDIANEEALKQYLEKRRRQGAPEVCGVFHAAGIVRSRLLANEDIESPRDGLAAKAIGALQLHRLFLDQALDCFVLFSSASVLMNPPLLGVYMAGNAFLDALAHHRRANNQKALSINWGPWNEVGMAQGTQTAAGLGTISTAKGLAALHRLLQSQDIQTAVMPSSWQEFAAYFPALAGDPFFETLVANGGQGSQLAGRGLTLKDLAFATPERRQQTIGNYLQAEAARILGIQPDRFDIALPLSTYGLDSLMALQLKSRIEADLGAVLPVTRFLSGPSVQQLVQSVLDRVPLERPASPDSHQEVLLEGGTI